MRGFPLSGTAPDSAEQPAKLRRTLLRHFDSRLLSRFEELTGHRLHLLWHESHEFHHPAAPPILCPSARANVVSDRPLPGDCVICQRDHWRPFAPAASHGRQLRGACGAHGFWAGVRVGSLHPLTLVLHAAAPSPGFDEAVKLLLLVLRKVETALAAVQANRALNQALRQPPRPDRLSGPATSPPLHAHGPHAAAIVRGMLDHVHAHYHRPLDLSDVAAALGMNASYLSSLFAAHLGVHFHHYLSEFRLTKAMELLRDPLRRISDIAAATGHASPNHFNNLFKSMTGVSPSAWRNANQPFTPPSPPKNTTPGGKSKKS